MSRNANYLLVIDPSSEVAAQLNSLLRNSGISVHVLHAAAGLEARRLVREFKPLLMVYHPASEAAFPVAEAALLARDTDTPFAVRTAPGDAGALLEAMRHTPAMGMDRQDEQMLVRLTERLLRTASAAAQGAGNRQGESETLARLNLVLASTREAIAYIHEGLHAAANPAYLNMLGVSGFGELEGLSVLEILSSDTHDIKQLVRDFGHGQFPAPGLELQARSRSGECLPVVARFDPAQLNGEPCVQMLLRPAPAVTPAPDMPVTATAAAPRTDAAQPPSTEAVAPGPAPVESAPACGPAPAPLAPKEAEALADQNDPLTGLLRRSVFMRWLEQRIDELPDDQRGGLLFMQPDASEETMREASVAQMDACTRALARALGQHLASSDLACRFGDYAFALLAQREGKNQLRELAGDIQQHMRQLRAEEPDLLIPEGFCVGFVLLDPHAHDAETAVSQARNAWFEAREQGNAIARYKPERSLGLDVSEEARWATRIHYALNNEDFYTAQYAITNLEGETEGLVENRTFLHEDDADLSYEAFQAGAELTGLASQIDRTVIPGLFRVLAGSRERHIVNVSSSSLQDFSFANWLRREMSSAGIDGSRLVLQWPAVAAREHPKAARRLIEELQSSGCKFSLSGMDGEVRNRALISEFEPSYVRLDPQLTNDLRSNQECTELTKLVVREARAVSALTIASDVSNSNDLAILWQCGVKLVSGDFLQSAPRVIGI